MVGNFEVPVTAGLRELFSRTHAKMSGTKPANEQYSRDEQYELYLACEVALPGDNTKLDAGKTEKNLLELIHFLNKSGVPIPQVIGDARCFSKLTRSVSTRLRIDEVRLAKKTASSALHFVAPKALEVAVA